MANPITFAHFPIGLWYKAVAFGGLSRDKGRLSLDNPPNQRNNPAKIDKKESKHANRAAKCNNYPDGVSGKGCMPNGKRARG